MSRIDFAPEITTQSSPNEPGTEANQAMFEEVDNDRKKNSNLSGPGAPTDCESRKPIVEAVHGKIDASRLPTQKAPELLAPELLVSEFKPADAINPDSITPDAIDQAHIADCFFEATLSSLANSEKGREKIKNMIEENADGSFTVRFPGAKDSPINVSKEDIKESGVNNNEKWADVLETAFLEHTHGGKPWSDLFKQSGISPLAGVTTMREAAQLLTGNDVMTDQFALTDLVSGQLTLGHTSKENVRRDLERALENGDTITAGANPSFAKYLGGRDPGPVPDQHVYAVLGFDPETDTVRVRNPWGSMAGSPLSDENSTADGITHLGDGVLSMSMDTFYGRFS
ncbi:MAG: hypothetical protein K8F91_14190, partial [Candidatus Obscuribacterales bacterium]|nr:hypothetical protein [Candidatus Obscuribacterales bacterium]